MIPAYGNCLLSQAASKAPAACLEVLDGQNGGDGGKMRIHPNTGGRIDKSGHVHLYKRIIFNSFRLRLRHYQHISHGKVDQSCEPMLLRL